MTQRRILLAVSGLSPQIITETLYGLAVAPDEPHRFIPNEIHVVTTAQGADRIKLLLLSHKPGWFHQMLNDFTLPNIRFDDTTIHTVANQQNEPLNDIRNADDNNRIADKLTKLIAEFTNDAETSLHVSIAGGRKTMGFFAGYALSLFARPQDRLSHVLVSPEFESHPEFFYPTPYQHIIIGRDPANTPLDAHTALVELAELPVVSLRDGLPEQVLAGDSSYSEAVIQARRALDPPRLEINLDLRTVSCATIKINLTPRDFAFYLWFVQRLQGNNPAISPEEPTAAEDYLQLCVATRDKGDGSLEQIQAALTDGMSAEYFRQRRSTTNNALTRALGKKLADPYLIASLGGNNNKRYALSITPSYTIVQGTLKRQLP